MKSWGSIAARGVAPSATGARLNRTARHVHVANATLPEIARLSVAKAMEHYAQLAVAGWRGEIATRIVKEVADRLRFLVDVGLGLSDA